MSKAGCEAVQAAANDAYAHRSGDDACSNEHLLIYRIACSLYARWTTVSLFRIVRNGGLV